MAAALALADAVGSVAGFVPDLKWPNDLVVADRKLAGVLAERELGSGTGNAAVVVGAGVNVTRSAFPPELEDVATSCELVAGRGVDREAILAEYLDRLAGRLDDLDRAPAAYRARLATIGRRVRVDGTGASLTGTALDVRDTGELVVRDDAGCEHDVTAGDVVHVRMA
jgi:BirA family biotin operon repressor/biotin-[acetyl-CoA-carboxylase] ligase